MPFIYVWMPFCSLSVFAPSALSDIWRLFWIYCSLIRLHFLVWYIEKWWVECYQAASEASLYNMFTVSYLIFILHIVLTKLVQVRNPNLLSNIFISNFTGSSLSSVLCFVCPLIILFHCTSHCFLQCLHGCIRFSVLLLKELLVSLSICRSLAEHAAY